MLEEQIKKLIIEKYGSVRQFALKIDVPGTTVSTILQRGIDNSNVGNVIKICKALNLSIDSLVENKKLVNNTVQIPVLSTIKSSIPIDKQPDIIEYIEIPKQWTLKNKQFYALKINDDSMMPKYNKNDIVIFEQIEDMSVTNNKDCAVMINDETTFKKVLLNENGIVLVPYNIDSYETKIYSKKEIKNTPIKIIGVAREKRTKI